MKKSFLDIIVNILLGASWALVLVGSSIAFYVFYPFGLFSGLVAGFMGSLLGLFLIILLETFSLQSEKLKEMKKQTKLLESIQKRIDLHDTVSDY